MQLKTLINFQKQIVLFGVAESQGLGDFGCSRDRILGTLGVEVGFFYPTPEVQLNNFCIALLSKKFLLVPVES